LLSIQCNKDTQLFLCSLFAPVCVEQAAIYPCRSLCESVKQSCSIKMLSYGYQWPEMFNCSKFPEDNGLCIQSPNQQTSSLSTTEISLIPTTTTITTTPTTTIKAFKSTTKINKSNKKVLSQTCHGCEENNTLSSMNNMVTSYCNSDLVIRGRIPGIKASRFDLLKQKPIIKQNKTMSLFVSVPRRDRKVLKGARFNLHNYLTEHGMLMQDLNEEENLEERIDNLDMFIMSDYHLNLANIQQNSVETKRLKMRSMSVQNQCKCDKLKYNLKPKMKYLIFGNVLRIKRANLKPADNNLNTNENRRQHKRRHNSKNKQQRFVKLIYLNGVYSWHSAKAFVDYIEDDTLNKENMCKDIRATISEINRIKNLLI
jgi:hypothetical protein